LCSQKLHKSTVHTCTVIARLQHVSVMLDKNQTDSLICSHIAYQITSRRCCNRECLKGNISQAHMNSRRKSQPSQVRLNTETCLLLNFKIVSHNHLSSFVELSPQKVAPQVRHVGEGPKGGVPLGINRRSSSGQARRGGTPA